ncbi:polyamine-transporting ATPase 13A3-like isoform X8 [Ptychodera flava]|uniref:polyamine-transporting ATPase 13A3-like isoform X8 n=1 Tax=Ptychodera flava TaxID=63121 RepID=UPI00396A836C
MVLYRKRDSGPGVAYHRTQSVRTVLNEGEDDEIECIGYKRSVLRVVLCYIGMIWTAGILWLIFYWRADWKLKCMAYQVCLSEATWVLIKDGYTQNHVSKVQRLTIDKDSGLTREDIKLMLRKDVLVNSHEFRFFRYQKLKYIWNPTDGVFSKLRALDDGVKSYEFFQQLQGLSEDEQRKRRFLYGENVINIRVRSYFVLLIQEVLNPFYVFQLFSVLLWFSDEYYYYASCIVIMSAGSIFISLVTTRKQSVMLRDMVASSHMVQISRSGGECLNFELSEIFPPEPDSSLVASSPMVQISRSGEEFMVDEKKLVPGDVLVIPPNGCPMTCDAVLLTGNCIVNESMLTGESVPITKTPLPNNEQEANVIYSPEEHKRHTLYCGTQVIQTRYYGSELVKAVVVRTGFSTAKGTLVRAILYPKPMDIKLYRDALKFISVMFGIAAIGFIYTIIVLALQDATAREIVLKALDIITIAVPPALPAALTIGIVYAQNRLKRKSIYCISPSRINLCGTLDVVCFDKTGTLTEDGLDLMGVVPAENARFSKMVTNIQQLPFDNLLVAMTTCHSLTRIQGELNGDPLDVKMFDATNWTLEEPTETESSNFDMLMPTIVKPPGTVQNYNETVPNSDFKQVGTEVGIVRQFPFSSSLQRMSVITRTLGEDHMAVYSKGAPEKILSLCSTKSIPEDFHKMLVGYTKQGFRVLAIAWKPLDPSLQWHKALKVPRDDVENDLQLLGLLVMQNKLKPETTPVIKELIAAQIRIVMVTGDNMLTAVNVARKCGILQPHDRVIMVEALPPDGIKVENITWTYAETDIPPESPSQETSLNAIIVQMEANHKTNYHFAMGGKSFAAIRDHYPYLMPRFAVSGTVFARMSPNQKAQLVESLQELEYSVGMCGDGANDTGALKTAHAGISLSEAEASVASPFTSKIPNITCVPEVIREGRAALVTSFSMFKYMALYSVIQFVSVMILYSIQSNLGDFMFMYIDLCIITVVAIFMGRSEAYAKIVTRKPLSQLMTTPILASLILQITVQALVQTTAFFVLKLQSWFEPLVPNEEDYYANIKCYETTTIFLVSCFQYLIVAVAFSTGKPYTKPIYRNYLYSGALVVLTIFTTIVVLVPWDKLENLLELRSYPVYAFRGVIIGIAVGNLVISLLIEFGVVPRYWLKYILECMWCRETKPSRKFNAVEIEMENDPEWPPLEGASYPTVEHPAEAGEDNGNSSKELLSNQETQTGVNEKGDGVSSTQF